MSLSEIAMHTTKHSPTGQSYGEFLRAYRFFNQRLFLNRLPHCLITLHRHRTAYGYFWGKRYKNKDDVVTDEIAMNPDFLRDRPDRVSLSTLVHEMVHLWQHHFGKASRSGYHNREWAEKMEQVGLMPSTTAAPGGARTGQNCSHYIIDGGPFDKACAALLAGGFHISWGSAPIAKISKGRSGKRTKYECPTCDTCAWGKDGLHIRCNDCDELMEEVL